MNKFELMKKKKNWVLVTDSKELFLQKGKSISPALCKGKKKKREKGYSPRKRGMDRDGRPGTSLYGREGEKKKRGIATKETDNKRSPNL